MITTVQEGMERPQQLPALRVGAAELLDWLEERGRVSAGWRRQLPALRRAVADAHAAVAGHAAVAAALRALPHVGYYDCRRALDALAATEPTTRTLLGRYTSPALRALDDACRTFRRGNCHVADAADELRGLLRHDVRDARAAIDAAHTRAARLRDTAASSRHYAERLRAEHARMCAEWGVAAGARARPLEAQLAEVPAVLLGDTVRALLRYLVAGGGDTQAPLQGMVDFYLQFDRFARACCDDDEEEEEDGEEELLGTLRAALGTRGLGVRAAVRRLARCCGSDWADVLLRIQNTDRLQRLHAQADAEAEAETELEPEHLAWSVPEGAADGAQDFGIVLEAEGTAGTADTADAEAKAEEGKDEDDGEDDGERDETEGGFHGLLEALLHDGTLRAAVVDELWELKDFFGQRAAEAAEDARLQASCAGNTATDFYAATGHARPALDAARAEQYARALDAMLDVLEGARTRRLLELQDSAHTRARLAHAIARKQQQAAYQEQRVRECEAGAAAADAAAADHARALEHATQRARQLVDDLHASLAELFPHRDVFITGV